MAHIKDKGFYDAQKWVLIIDESIQFGNKKLLSVIAFPETRATEGGSPSFRDVMPVVMRVGESRKSEDVSDTIKTSINPEQISYVISDEGNNLTKGIKYLNCKHIPDIKHRFSLIIKNIYEKDEIFTEYTKELGNMRAKLSMSKYARIVPPNQRIMSRFMNLTPLFDWGVKMLTLTDKEALSEEETEKSAFIKNHRSFIVETHRILHTLEKIQSLLKHMGFNTENATKALLLFEGQNNNNACIIKKMVSDYFNEMLLKFEGKTICCSSDIIESCFGKHKELIKNNKSVGISDLCLCMAAMMSPNDLHDTEAAMESKKIEDIKTWRKKNIPPTLFAQKRELMKKCDGTYS